MDFLACVFSKTDNTSVHTLARKCVSISSKGLRRSPPEAKSPPQEPAGRPPREGPPGGQTRNNQLTLIAAPNQLKKSSLRSKKRLREGKKSPVRRRLRGEKINFHDCED